MAGKLDCSGFRPDPKKPKQEKIKAHYRIRKMSEKREKENKEYLILNREFLKDKKCQCKDCPNKATTVHHQKGRIGKLLCDIRFWLACCMDCHTEIENHPTWAYKMGYSLFRNKI